MKSKQKKNNQSKFHKFWLEGRNPITMKKCLDEDMLHRHNRTQEMDIERARKRKITEERRSNFLNQELC